MSGICSLARPNDLVSLPVKSFTSSQSGSSSTYGLWIYTPTGEIVQSPVGSPFGKFYLSGLVPSLYRSIIQVKYRDITSPTVGASRYFGGGGLAENTWKTLVLSNGPFFGIEFFSGGTYSWSFFLDWSIDAGGSVYATTEHSLTYTRV